MVLPSIEKLALQKRKPVFPNGVGIYIYVRNTSNILQCTKVYFGLFILSQIIVYTHTNNCAYPPQQIVDIYTT